MKKFLPNNIKIYNDISDVDYLKYEPGSQNITVTLSNVL